MRSVRLRPSVSARSILTVFPYVVTLLFFGLTSWLFLCSFRTEIQLRRFAVTAFVSFARYCWLPHVPRPSPPICPSTSRSPKTDRLLTTQVICEKVEKSDIATIDKKKYLVPADLTVGQFVYVIRKRIKLSPEKAIFIFVDEVLPPTAALMSSIYEEHKDEDGYVSDQSTTL